MAEETDVKDKKKESSKAKKKVSDKDAGKISSKAAQFSNHIAVLKNRIEINSEAPLPRCDAGHNKAYSASLVNDGASSYVAIVCDPKSIPRQDDFEKYSKLNTLHVSKLVDYGKVFWPLTREERFVIVYESVFDTPFLKKGDEAALGWSPEDVTSLIAKPMIGMFQEFKERGFVHGAISPYNMFGTSLDRLKTDNRKNIVLGDGLSSSCLSFKPTMYLSVERAMADPCGRGLGTQADDLYAFGVSLMVFLRSVDPTHGLRDEDIIRRKLEGGTYSTLIGKERLKGDILELVRGVLHDDVGQRWGFEELMTWGDGRRLSPKQSLRRKRSSRPFVFHNEKYMYLPSLAMALDKNISETKRVVDDDTLLQWVERAVGDEDALERTEDALQTCKDAGTGAGYPERLVSSLSVAFDTRAPLRYKGVTVNGDGLGCALAEAFVMNKDVGVFADILSGPLVTNWLNYYENPNADVAGFFSKIDQCRRFVKNKRIGDGIERCLYYLCPEVHCLSEKLEKYLVYRSSDLLAAFEDICASGKAPVYFIDRHIAAFLMQKNAKAIDGYLYDINSGEKPRILMANLRCLAELQGRCNFGPVPAISKAFADKMDTIYELYHDREIRDKLRSNISGYVEGGDLRKIVKLLDSPDILDRDSRGFKAASREYARLTAEEAELEVELQDRDTYGLTTAQEWTAIASGVLAVLVVLGSVLMLFVG